MVPTSVAAPSIESSRLHLVRFPCLSARFQQLLILLSWRLDIVPSIA
jgi:hypothetical protein